MSEPTVEYRDSTQKPSMSGKPDYVGYNAALVIWTHVSLGWKRHATQGQGLTIVMRIGEFAVENGEPAKGVSAPVVPFMV